MPLRPYRFLPGAVLSAAALQDLHDEVERLGRIAGIAPVQVEQSAGGIAVRIAQPWAGWIKLTGGGAAGKYAWTAQVAVAGGGWANLPGTLNGTATLDPAVEQNANTAVVLTPAPVVWAWRDPLSATLFFQAGSC
jgi:hypothetical protein